MSGYKYDKNLYAVNGACSLLKLREVDAVRADSTVSRMQRSVLVKVAENSF